MFIMVNNYKFKLFKCNKYIVESVVILLAVFLFLLVHCDGNNSQEIYLDSNIPSQNLFEIDSNNSIDAEFSHGKKRLNTIINLKSIFVYIFIFSCYTNWE